MTSYCVAIVYILPARPLPNRIAAIQKSAAIVHHTRSILVYIWQPLRYVMLGASIALLDREAIEDKEPVVFIVVAFSFVIFNPVTPLIKKALKSMKIRLISHVIA